MNKEDQKFIAAISRKMDIIPSKIIYKCWEITTKKLSINSYNFFGRFKSLEIYEQFKGAAVGKIGPNEVYTSITDAIDSGRGVCGLKVHYKGSDLSQHLKDFKLRLDLIGQHNKVLLSTLYLNRILKK